MCTWGDESDQPGLSLERLCESGEGGATCFPFGGGRGSAVEVRQLKLSDLGDGGGNRRDPGKVYKKGRPGSQAGGWLCT